MRINAPSWLSMSGLAICRALRAAAIVACLLGCAREQATAQPSPSTGPVSERIVAVDARAGAAQGMARLTVRMSRAALATAFVMEKPDRLVVELPEVNFQMPAGTGRKGAGLISSFRFGLFAPGRSRIVIDLAEPALLASIRSEDMGNEVVALIIELKAATRPEYAAAAERAKATAPEAAKFQLPSGGTGMTDRNGPRAANDARPVLVIDPGHGGIDPGAVTGNTAEKAIVLAFALKLRDQLGERYRVVMTRDDDRFVALSDRVKLARQNGAAMFISIHADSLSQAQDVRGATIYTGSERATDLESARLAARENEVDALAGVETPRDDREDIADILMDLAKRETRHFSASLATTLVKELGGAVKLHRIPQRSAGFRVLSAPDVPSVLIELGYVSSARDVELLTSEVWRNEAAGAVKRSIDRFFDARSGMPAPSRSGLNRTAPAKPAGIVPETTGTLQAIGELIPKGASQAISMPHEAAP
jgi:N-acetylmuramoyl-L-alanine amidase